MKKHRRILALALIMLMPSSVLGGYAQAGSCTHQNVYENDYLVSCTPVSATEHEEFWCHFTECEDCDYVVYEDEPRYLMEHYFFNTKENGVTCQKCSLCEYIKMPCTHKKTYTMDDAAYSPYNNFTHNVIITTKTYCWQCNAYIRSNKSNKNEKHTFESSTVLGQSIEKCAECGYVKQAPPTLDEATELAENRFAEEATKNGSEIKEVLSGMIMSDYSTYFTIAIEGIQDSSSKWGNVLSKFLYEALTDPAKKLTPVVQDEKKAVLVHLIKEMMAGEYGASVSMNDDVGNLSAILSLGEKELDEYLKTIAPDLTRLGEARDVFRYGNELKIGGYALEVVGLISAGVDIAGATAAEKQQMIELIAQYDKNMRYLDNLCGATDGALYEACDAVRREMRMAIEGVFQAADNTRKIGFGKLLAEQLMEKGISLAGGSVASALLLGGKIGGAITSGTGRYIEASDELLYLGLIKNDVKEAMENAVVTKDQALFDLTELYFAVQRNGMDATQTFYERYSETAVGIWHTFWKNFDPEETVNNIDKQRKALAKNQAMLREDMERLLTEELTQTAPIETVAPASTKYAVAKGSSRIRSAPNTDNRNITGYAKKGDRYEILELVPDNRGYSDWYKVLLDDGSIGYISAGVTDEVEVKQPNTQSSKVAKSVSLGNQYAVAKGSANIRSSPGITGSSIKDHAYEGDSYQILGVVPDQNGGSDWYKIQLSDGSVGYISSGITDAVEIDKPKTAPSKDAKSTASGKKYAVAKGSANIRSSPDSSDNSNITDKAYKGDSYQILDVVPNPNGGSDWYKIQLSDGSVGYISSGITDAVEKK